ncbi:MAG: tripartite tricarboxylate transporter substrate-binding protein [Betaproteobacteria bacterium]
MYSNLPYDPQKDFTPISLLSRSPNIFVVQPPLPVQTVQQFIAYAKATPGTMNFGSGGRGTSSHLSGELLKSMSGLQLVHVPYKGATPAITDLIAGHIQLFIGNLPPILPQVQAGKLRALAVTSSKRWPELPDLPTMAESGLPGYETVAWFALLGPANLPPAIAQRLSIEAAAVMRMADVKATLLKQGMEAIGTSAEELTSFIATDIARWKKVAADSGTRLD